MNGFGYRPDRAKRPGETPDRLAAFDGSVPVAHDLRELVLDVLVQGNLGSCVAQAGMQAIRMRELAQGRRTELGSRLFAYYLARALEHTTGYDAGASLRSLFDGLRKFGYPPESAWPYDPTDTGSPSDAFRKAPSTTAVWAAYDQRAPVVYQRLGEEGADRIAALKRAIATGYPVCFGCEVSRDFSLGYVEETVAPPKVAFGDHALIFAGYDGDRFLVLNSWSTGWGDGGYCWFSPEYVMQTRDLWIVERAP